MHIDVAIILIMILLYLNTVQYEQTTDNWHKVSIHYITLYVYNYTDNKYLNSRLQLLCYFIGMKTLYHNANKFCSIRENVHKTI